MPPFTVDPVRKYEFTKGGASRVSQIQCAPKELGTGNNQTVVTAVSGERIRVMGWRAQGTTSTQGYFYLKSASGGTLLTARWTFPPSTSLPDILPITDGGYYETNTGEGLFIDITTAALSLDLYYVTYVP